MRKGASRKVVFGMLLATVCLPVAGLPATPVPSPEYLVESVTGSVSAKGHFLLELVAGPIATRAIKVYSEPSHTLLVRALDRTFVDSSAGQAWLTGQRQEASQVETVSEPLAGSNAKLALTGPAAEDGKIAVWVYGTWPGGVVEERLISDATVNVRDFSFATYVDPAAPPEDPVHCCTTSVCGTMCIDCSGPGFCCCALPGQCAIGCAPSHPCE